MPYADAIYPAWGVETNHYNNIKPQNSNLNSGAWRTLEQTIRNMAIGTSENFDVYTGGFDIKGFLNNVENLFSIYTIWYKMVIKNSRGIVFAACNDKQSYCNTELENMCENICMKIGWLTPRAQIKIICCSIKDVYASGKLAIIPGTEGVTEDLYFYQR